MNKDKGITPFNNKREKHGYWVFYVDNIRLRKKCFYVNDNKVGYEEWHYVYTSNDLRLA